MLILLHYTAQIARFFHPHLGNVRLKKIGEKQGVDKILVPLAVYLAERHNLI